MPGDIIVKIPPLDEQQEKFIGTPIEEIPAESLFTCVPLIARYATGVSNVKELIYRQRISIKDAVVSSSSSASSGAPPPEIRFDYFDNAGSLKMKFIPRIIVPAGSEEKIKFQITSNQMR